MHSYIGHYNIVSLGQHWYHRQRFSGDLYLWHDHCACKVAWPTTPDGRKVSAEELLRWMRDRNLVWGCKCTNPGRRTLVKFTRNGAGDIVAECTGHCEFILNLTQIEESTTFVDSYPHLAVGQDRAAYERALDRHSAWERGLDSRRNIAIEGTYQGWCGEFSENRVQPGDLYDEN